jgi:predicted nucleic acid-binding protein
VTRCVLDTDVVIAALEKRDAHHSQATAILKDLIDADVDRLISTINYAEALVRPAADDRELRTAVDAIQTLGIEVAAPTPAMARDAARLRGSNISLADGFALATARASKAAVASFDRRVQRALERAGLELAPGLR